MIRALLDLLFPPRCILCHRFLPGGETNLCDACAQWVLGQRTLLRQGKHFTLCVSAFSYEEPIKESVHRFKFQDKPFYAETYGLWLAAAVRRELTEEFEVISWVPVSKRRRRKRGYDQSELLCREAAKILNIPAEPCLKKIKHNCVQSRIRDREKRKKNVAGVYVPRRHTDFQNKSILLVDDIITTGATLEECAKVLKQAGAGRVVCATLAAKN